MKNILVIESSPRGENSVSRKLTKEIIAALLTKFPDAKVNLRDLDQESFPHLTDAHLKAFYTAPNNLTPKQKELIKLSNQTVDEFVAADIVVIGSPMWNWSITSSLKAWIDHLVRVGRTFNYTTDGINGLLEDKPVFIAISRGGIFSSGPALDHDFQEPYLRAVLGFMGIKNVEFFRAEDLANPNCNRELILQNLHTQIIKTINKL